jgi:hypothetical protein
MWVFLLAEATFLGAFCKIAKNDYSFVMCVRLSFPMEQVGSHWTGFD